MYPATAYQNYVETTVSTSEPIELTRLLYRGGVDALRRARAAMSLGNIVERNKQVVRTQQIVAELVSALKPEELPDLTLRLAQVYEYVLFLVQMGNFEQRDQPLAEAEKLLGTLLEGWERCDPAVTSETVNAA